MMREDKRMKNVGHVKRFLCLAMIAIMIVFTAAPAMAASKGSGAYVVTTVEKNNRLRVRSTPNGDVVDYLKKGTVVSYKSSKSGWWYVQYRASDGELKNGYVYRVCLTSVNDLRTTKFTSVDNLYVRKEHKTNSVKIKMKKGTKVLITGQYKNWVRITNSKGNSGWVLAVYLRKA